jgi:hypothetical protein
MYGYFVYFFRFGMLYQEKSGNPLENLGDITFYQTLASMGQMSPFSGEPSTSLTELLRRK